MRTTFKNAGFTLVELLVATMLGTFIALVAVGTLRAITTSSEMVNSNIDSAAEIRFASSLISTDLMNLYRDQTSANMKLVGTTQEVGQGAAASLTFYTVARAKARPDQPEADVYEVQYFLAQDQEQSALFRRIWPYPDPNDEADPGGVLAVIAEDIDVFEVRYFDGAEWSNEWPEDMQTIPQLVEVNIISKPPRRGSPAVESVMVSLVRSVGQMVEALQSTEQLGSTEQQTGGAVEGTTTGQMNR